MTAAWDEARVRAAIAAIVADAEGAVVDGAWPNHPLDEEHDVPYAGVYLGSAGMLWGLRRLGSRLDVDPLAVLRRGANEEERGDPGLMIGEAGVLLVTRADDERLARLAAETERHPAWELFYGGPGTALAARAAGLDDAWEQSARVLLEEWERVGRGLWTNLVGGHATRYVGPAHGFAGNVHVLRGLVRDDELRARVDTVLRPLAVPAAGGLNVPPTPDHPPNRTQWCHGAPGIVSTLGDLLADDLLLGFAEHTWAHGPLEKGVGLCHGTAGNGYALLRTWALTGDERWLQRARGFAAAALEQVEQMRVQHGRGRYTLFTGDLGAALFAQACLDGDPRFPILDAV